MPPLDEIIRTGRLRAFLLWTDEFADPSASAYDDARRGDQLIDYHNALDDQSPMKQELRRSILAWYDDPEPLVKMVSLLFSRLLHFEELCDKVAAYVANGQADDAPWYLKNALQDYAREFGMQDVVLRLS